LSGALYCYRQGKQALVIDRHYESTKEIGG
jgi:hypothetical protein